MVNKNISDIKNRIDNLIEKIKIFHPQDVDIEMISHFTKYVCVLISGMIEKSIQQILFKYSTAKTGDTNLQSFVLKKLKRFQNARSDKIEQLFQDFNSEWKLKLTSIRDYSRLKGSLNSIISNRNKIAHGENINLTLNNLKQYYSDTVKIIKNIDKIINPSR